MSINSVTVFANFRIDSEERFTRMCDSLASFKDSDIKEWVINVRGSFREKVIHHIESNIDISKLIIFRLESKQGWFHDSKIMIDKISSSNILFWIEDHILIGGIDLLNITFLEIKQHHIDYLEYSWHGDDVSIEMFRGLEKTEASTLFALKYDIDKHKQRLLNSKELIGRKIYIISVVAIFSKDLFRRLIITRDPYFRRWSKFSPFDFEKRWDDTHWLPFIHGVPKFELFAAIDDDNLYKGSSLISRGLYPERASRVSVNKVDELTVVKMLRDRLRSYPFIYVIASRFWRLIERLRNQF